ncbi:MAG: DUF5671 domain-containing protein [Acidimicrobiia bacterium]|nr:DUF5671 domain-containing protein [Acidimicrobiia bacterium]
MGAIGILSSILTLAIPVAIVVLVVRAVARRRSGSGAVETGTVVRRFFSYLVMFGLTIVVGVGLASLLALALPDPNLLVGSSNVILARSISFLVIGGAVLAGMALWTRRLLDSDPSEQTSFGWASYVTAVAIVALAIAMTGLVDVLGWLAGLEDFEPSRLANVIVWALIWAAFWMLARRRLPGERNIVHLVIGSGTGLTVGVIGLAGVMSTVLQALYDQVASLNSVDRLADELWRTGILVLVGGLVWWRYWLSVTVRAGRGVIWDTYVLLFGVLGGLITAISAGSILLYQALEWLFGDPSAATAADHFSGIPVGLAAAGAGLWLWWYHRAVLGPSRAEKRHEVDRVYEYLAAGVGLIAAVSGLAIVFVALIEAMTPSGIAESSSATNTLIAAATLLLVGGPVWWRFWSSSQRLAAATSVEIASPTRRVYLLGLFGVGGVTALISLIVGFFIILQRLLDGELGAETLRDVRVPIALLITVGAVAGYHWMVFQEDRRRAPARPKAQFDQVVLLGAANGLAAQVAEVTGARVKVWRRLGLDTPPLLEEEVLSALAASASLFDQPGVMEGHRKVLVVAGDHGIEVIPFDD